jgi:hypothetical protein
VSYILAALKKSEQERKQLDRSADDGDASVYVGRALDSSSVDMVQRPLRAIYLLVVVVLLFVLAYLLLNPVANTRFEIVVAETLLIEAPLIEAPLTDTAAVEVSVAEVLAVKEVAVKTVGITEEASSIKEDFIENTEIIDGVIDEVVDIEQASEAQLAHIPSILITSHIYSSQAKRRSIVINDERLVEGDFVAAKVQVKEITHQGVILRVNDSLLAVSRSRGWNR